MLINLFTVCVKLSDDKGKHTGEMREVKSCLSEFRIMSELNYEHVFNVLVDKTAEYVTSNNLKVMVLGISGGIDSTVVAAICHEVSKKTGIPLIGRSLPIKNKSDEFATSVHVGEAFCNEFSVYRLERSYRAALFDACADAGDVNMANSY